MKRPQKLLGQQVEKKIATVFSRITMWSVGNTATTGLHSQIPFHLA
jgi:hypothetical protein